MDSKVTASTKRTQTKSPVPAKPERKKYDPEAEANTRRVCVVNLSTFGPIWSKRALVDHRRICLVPGLRTRQEVGSIERFMDLATEQGGLQVGLTHCCSSPLLRKPQAQNLRTLEIKSQLPRSIRRTMSDAKILSST